jgi:hypothetical protein
MAIFLGQRGEMPMSHRQLTALLAIALFSINCVHTGLGEPPLDTDLQNDGSTEAQKALLDEYRLSYQSRDGNWIARPGADPAAVGVDEVKGQPWEDDTIAYLESDEATEESLSATSVAFSRFIGNGTLDNLIVFGFATGGAVWGGMAAYDQLAPVNSLAETNIIAWSVLGGAVTGFIISWPVLFMEHLFLEPFMHQVASSNYRAAVRAYNQSLEGRIKANVQKPVSEEAAAAIQEAEAEAAEAIEGAKAAENPPPLPEGQSAPEHAGDKVQDEPEAEGPDKGGKAGEAGTDNSESNSDGNTPSGNSGGQSTP